MNHHTQNKPRTYLSGPMTGIPEFNYPAFNEAAKWLREQGHLVFNPAETFNGDTTKAWSYYMRVDIEAIMESTEIRVLPGWESSAGAMLEVLIALAIGLPIRRLDGEYIHPEMADNRPLVAKMLVLQKEQESILHEAFHLVHGSRGTDYGHPYFDFRRTAMMLTGLFVDRLKPDQTFSPRDVPLIMNCVKMSREINSPKRDNRTDGAGYWETLDMVDRLEQTL